MAALVKESLEDARGRLEHETATEADLTTVASNIIEELTQSEGVKMLLGALQRVVASKSERSYIIAGLGGERRDRPRPSSSELVAFTNRMIKRCEIIRGR